MSSKTPTSPPPRRQPQTIQPRTPPTKPQPLTRETTTPLRAHHTTTSIPPSPSQDTNQTTFPFPTDSPVHFSPSKARAAAQQSQQLVVLKRWLTTMPCPPSTPTQTQTRLVSKWEVEHRSLGSSSNPDLAAVTTRWLQEVMSCNRAADERRRLLFEARREELDHYRQRRDLVDGESRFGSPRDLLAEIYATLGDRGREAVESLAESAVQLGMMPAVDGAEPMAATYGRAVMETTLRSQEMQRHIEELQGVLIVLQRQLKLAEDKLMAFREEETAAATAAESMRPQTMQWRRETKQIAQKTAEYQDRIAALERSRPGAEVFRSSDGDFVSIEDVLEVQKRVERRKSNIARLEQRLKVFNGLPPTLEASREEVQRARSELQQLKARREELFGMLAERQ